MTLYATLREANIARNAAWGAGKPPLDLSFCGVELAGEAGEVCNVIKKIERERLGWKGSTDTVEHLAEEIGDVTICLDLIAMRFGIDIEAATAAKFNATSEKIGLPHRLGLPLAINDVLAERRRQQQVEGWTAAHDDQHTMGDLGRAGLQYAAAAAIATALGASRYDADTSPPLDSVNFAFDWPWERRWWKPGTVRRMLVKACALLIAEIERLDRRDAAAKEPA